MGNALSLLQDTGHALGAGGARSVDAYDFFKPGLVEVQVPKLHAADEKEIGLFSDIFGIPTPFPQIGSYLGMTGPAAFAVDILTDPFTYLTGGLSAFGKAAKALNAYTRTLGRGGRLLQKATKAEMKGVLSPVARNSSFLSDNSRLLSRVDRAEFGGRHLHTSRTFQGQTNALSRTPGINAQQILDHQMDRLTQASRLETTTLEDLLRKLSPKAPKDSVVASLQGAMARSTRGVSLPEPWRAASSEHLKRLLTITQKDGVAAGRTFLKDEIRKRDRLSRIGLNTLENRNWRAYKKNAKEIKKLWPSYKAEIMFSKDRMKAMKQMLNGKIENATGFANKSMVKQGAAGQRGVLAFRLPGTNIERVIGMGSPLIAKQQKFLTKHPKIKSVFQPKPKQLGLLPDGRIHRLSRDIELGALPKGSLFGRGVANWVTASSIATKAAAAIKGFADEGTRSVENVFKLLEADKRNVDMFAGLSSGEFKAAFPFVEDRAIVRDIMENGDEYFGAGSVGTRQSLSALRGKSNKVGAVNLKDETIERLALNESFLNEASLYKKLKPESSARAAKISSGKVKAVTEDHVMMANAMGDVLQDTGRTMMEHGLIKSVIKDYYPRIVTVLDKQKWRMMQGSLQNSNEVNTFVVNSLERKIPGWDQLMQWEAANPGVIKVEKDPAKVLFEFIRSNGRAAANKRFIERVGEFKYIPNGIDDLDTGIPIMVGKLDSLPEKVRNQYVAMNDENIMNFVGRLGLGFKNEITVSADDIIDIARTDKGVVKGATVRRVGTKTLSAKEIKKVVQDPSGKVASIVGEFEKKMPFRDGAFVHEDFAKYFRVYLESPGGKSAPAARVWTEKFLEGALKANALMKRSLLLMSAFHYMALTESAISTMGGSFIKHPGSFLRAANRDFMNGSDMIQYGIKHGLQLGSIADVEKDLVLKTVGDWAGKLEGKVPFVPTAMQGFRKVVFKWDAGLWDYYHNSLKVGAFNELFVAMKSRHPTYSSRDIAESTAQLVNDAFGGQVWERLWVGKTGQRAARAMLLAPDWTTSNLRIAADVFAGRFIKKPGIPLTSTQVAAPETRAFFARNYWLRAGLLSAVYGNLANYIFTGFDGDPHFMDKNSEGFNTMLQLPGKDAKGRNRYMKYMKQFREPFELLSTEGLSPVNMLRRKSSPVVQTFVTQLMGQTMFGRPIVGTEDGPISQLGKRFGYIASSQLPITVQEATGAGQRAAKPLSTALISAMGLPVKTEFLNKRGGQYDPGGMAAPDQLPAIFREMDMKAMYSKEDQAMKKAMLNVLPEDANLPVLP